MLLLRIIKTAILFCFLYITLTHLPSVNAQQIDVTVMPPNIELMIKPGAQVRIPYTITNRADAISLRPLIQTFSISNEGKTIMQGSTKNLPFQFWFLEDKTAISDGFSLSKGSTKKVILSITVAPETKEGDYYVAFIVESQPEYLDKQYSVRIKAQIASPLLITVTKTGKTQIEGAISDFKVAGRFFDSFDSIPISLKVRNNGKNVIYADGTITVRGFFGEKAVYPIRGTNILTNSERQLSTKISQEDYSAVLKGFFIGKYNVTTSISLSDGTVQLNESTSFYSFPLKIILLALLGSVLGLKFLRHKR